METGAEGVKVRVLIADDSDAYRAAAADVVTCVPGFEVVALAASGEEAVALTQSSAPDLALVDVFMPGIGGVEAARQIAAAKPGVVIVLISANERQLARSAAACGAAAALDKRELLPARLERVWVEQTAAL